MNKTINLQTMWQRHFVYISLAGAIALVSLLGVQSAYASINIQLDLGDSGGNVTELQTYLATNASIYPSGLVTGYFGPLTQAAVQRFQAAQGLVSAGTPSTTGYGRVGPQTMARINALMGGGTVTQQYWDAVPVLSSPSVQYSNNAATFTWTTSEPTQGQVYYDVNPLRADEATGPRQQPYVSGTAAYDGAGLQTVHTITIQNLQSNTLYYFLTRAVDSVGNMSMTWPSSFRTNQ
jgi:peptidoglycan hydrolase-like protein with peptidoglycan-binding domain